MADRYWVGGTGTWNTTSTTNWSASSGGASGASVPTVADSVFFDQASTYTVTMTGALACLDITVSAGTVTFAQGTSPTLNVRGSMTLIAGTVWSATGNITFSSTATGRTVTTNGTTLNCATLTFDGAGGAWTLGSALSIGNNFFDLRQGTLDTSSTGNYSLTCLRFNCNVGVTRTLNLNASTFTITSVGTAIDFQFATASTLNAGTSTIVLTGQGATISTISGGVTFNNVNFTSTVAATRAITGGSSNTFNNLSVTGPASAGVVPFTFDSRQTINGTLSTTGTAGNRRVFFASATYGISQDLVVNSAPSLTDADFRGLYVRGTSAPISGTRIGNRGECRGITFSTPKTVYWNLSGAQNWSANAWATTSTGTPSTDNFPLPQDTATFTNAGSVTGTITLDSAITYLGSIDCSTRTNAFTLSMANTYSIYGNFTAGSGITVSGGGVNHNFSGGTTQTITSAGKTFTISITIDTYGGTVQLADALNIGTSTLTVTNGTFDTKGYAVTAGILSSNNSNVRAISLGASTLTLNGITDVITFTTNTNLTFNAGTSTINAGPDSGGNWKVINCGSGVAFYDMRIEGSFGTPSEVRGTNTFRNLTIVSRATNATYPVAFYANQTITGTLTCSGASAIRRIFLRSDTIGTQRTITAAAISATDCDFRDINLAGVASGASPTRAGNCGGNSGITFPGAKTVYWNLAGAQNWSATGWATSSGGSPAVNNFPLAQDTAVFDNTGSVTGTITIDSAWNIGTFDASGRTSAMTLTTSTNNPVVYGDWKFGTGVTSSSTTGTINFSKNGTQTITSNGVQFGCPVTVNHPSGTVQLADALSLDSARTLTLTRGTFDAVTYNVTVGLFTVTSAASTLRMGSGTWTLSGTGTVWDLGSGPILFVGTSNIVLSNTSTSARTFNGGNRYYNKLTIGGTTGTSTTTILNSNIFGELASTKTVAHTIDFGGNANTFGKWSVTGTAGNVVTIIGTSTSSQIVGPAVTGVDYLAMGTWGISTTSPGEFYAGANSTGTAAAPVFRTAAPAPRTLYWVGGTGNWSSTTKWSTSSGGGSGAAIPTSLDAVVFDSASNATAYTATIDAGVTLARCASFTMAGPLSGNVTFAGTVGIAFHGNVSFAATGITRTYTGAMQWAGNSSYTFTTNGLSLASSTITIVGVGSIWSLGSALTCSTITVTFGTFNTSASNYAFTCGGVLSSNNSNVRTINFNNSIATFNGAGAAVINFTNATNLTFNAGASQINLQSGVNGINTGSPQTFYNVSFNATDALSIAIVGANTFNTLSFPGITTIGINAVTFSANQTITTLTLNAGTAAAYRTFLASNTIGTQRTLSVGTLTAGAADYDFRDIAITGAAAPLTGTRFGDCKGNSGITFPAAKTVYYRQTGSANWGATGTGSWSATSGGALDATQFPLAQDTAIFPAATYPASGSTTTVNANYNIGTIDMSLRTTNTMTLATGTTTPQIYGNWINGTGTTLTGTGAMTFAGRGSQQITSAGKTFTQLFTINSPSGSVTLQDAFTASQSSANVLTITQGTFDAGTYNVTLSGAAGGVNASSTGTRTIAVGSGTWTISGTTGAWAASTSTNLTVTGTGTISLTSASSKTFSGGSISYSGITLDQGGAGTLTISGNNTFKNITNTYSATGATTIALGNTTQTLTNPWTATGAATRVLTVSGTSAASPGTLIFSGSGNAADVDYLAIANVRAYPLTTSWYAGANSTNSGSLGWYFVAAGGTVYAVTITETGTGTDAITARVTVIGTISETGTGTDTVVGGLRYLGTITETGTGTDSISAKFTPSANITETATGSDVESAILAAISRINETATGTDTDAASLTAQSNIAETATGTDLVSARATFLAAVSESSTASDLISAAKAYLAAVSETATGTDVVSAAQTFRTVISEAATGTDAISAIASLFAQVSESATGADSFSALVSLTGQISESATATDVVVATKTYLSAILESAAGADAVSARATFKSQIAESSTAQDIVLGFLVAATQITESATGSDQISALRALAAAVVEAAIGTDAVTAKAIFRGILLEIATLTDSVNAPGSTYSAPVVELAVLQDLVRAAATFPTSITETATGTQTNSAAFIPYANITESATVTDAASAVANFAARMTETATISDQAIVAPSVFNAITVATATALDNFNPAGSIYNAPVIETAVVLDSLIGAFLWNLINTGQNPDWGDITSSQNPNWNPIDSAENFAGWTLISVAASSEPSWTSSAASPTALISINYNNNVNFGAGYLLYTGEQTNYYTLPVTGGNNTISSAFYVNGQFFVIGVQYGSGVMLRSSDGRNWTTVTVPNPSSPVLTVFGNGTQLGILNNGRTYISTDNGNTWTTGAAGQATFSYRTDVIWDGTKYVLNDGRRIRTSTDGLNWTIRFTAGVGRDRGSLIWTGPAFVAVFSSVLGPTTTAQIRVSANGVTWNTPTSSFSNAVSLFQGPGLVGLFQKNGSVIALSGITGTNFTATFLTNVPGYTYYPNDSYGFQVAQLGGLYFVPGVGGSALTSKYITTTDFQSYATRTVAGVSPWANIDDNQSPNWQNISNI
jgi:fibronectin-binding autotransporter adhesin